MALTWGSSFLLIKIAIRDFDSALIPLGRTAFGAAALLLIPGARQRIAREHWPRLLVLGFVWMAFPFFLYPLAEETVSSAITGMMNGGLPVVVTLVTAIWVQVMPSPRRIVAVLVGFSGIALIAIPSISDGSTADTRGIALLLIALFSYAVAINIARPLQSAYSPATLMLHVELVACVISLPLGIWGAKHSTFSWPALSALALLGVLGTGFAFVLFALLSKRISPVTGSIKVMPGFASAFELAAVFRIGLIALLFKAAGAPEVIAAVSTTRTTLTERIDNGRNFMLRILLSNY